MSPPPLPMQQNMRIRIAAMTAECRKAARQSEKRYFHLDRGNTEPGSAISSRVELRFGVHHQADPVGMESYRLLPKWEWHINFSLNQNSDTAIIRPKWDL